MAPSRQKSHVELNDSLRKANKVLILIHCERYIYISNDRQQFVVDTIL